MHCARKDDTLSSENLGRLMSVTRLSIRGLALAGLTFLAGCGICGCMTTDNTPVGQLFTYNGNAWRVADVRSEGRLVIVAVDPRLAGLGTEAAMRHPVGLMPEAEYRGAAHGWFATSGRFCSTGPAESSGPDGYTYHYSCWTPA